MDDTPSRQASRDPLRFHRKHQSLHSAFGTGSFGQAAEAFARFFGTPAFIIGQTFIVAVWITFNSLTLFGALRFDKYPFILLNLTFSTQAAYAAPLILLAQTRQADRDKSQEEADAEHREDIARHHAELLEANTVLTQKVHDLASEVAGLTRAIHGKIEAGPDGGT